MSGSISSVQFLLVCSPDCGLPVELHDTLCRLKDRIEGVLNTDRTVRLVVQLEAALHDSRLEVSGCTSLYIVDG